jgi:hypothetical protein
MMCPEQLAHAFDHTACDQLGIAMVIQQEQCFGVTDLFANECPGHKGKMVIVPVVSGSDDVACHRSGLADEMLQPQEACPTGPRCLHEPVPGQGADLVAAARGSAARRPLQPAPTTSNTAGDVSPCLDWPKRGRW